MAAPHEEIVRQYALMTAADPEAGQDIRAACRRYLADLENPRWEFRTELAEFCIEAIQTLFCHQQGEDLYGRPLRGTPFLLVDFQMFIIYNICGFFLPGTVIRRYQEVLLMLARKNGKTPFATALCWVLGLWYSASFSKIKTVAGSLKQNMEGFGFLSYNLHRLGLTVTEDTVHGLRVLDSSLGHSFSGAIWNGQISFEALAYKPDIFDAFNANIVHLDELELYKNSIPYGRLPDYCRLMRKSYRVNVQFTDAGNTLVCSISKSPVAARQVSFEDGHSQLQSVASLTEYLLLPATANTT